MGTLLTYPLATIGDGSLYLHTYDLAAIDNGHSTYALANIGGGDSTYILTYPLATICDGSCNCRWWVPLLTYPLVTILGHLPLLLQI